MDKINAGDVIISLSGRDSGGYYLVVGTDCDSVYIVDGKTRKVKNPKKKNVRHVKIYVKAVLIELAEKVKNGTPVSDKRVRRSIDSVKEHHRREDLCRKTTL